MKGYYLYCTSNKKFVGVEKKIDYQVKVFNEYFNCEKLAIEKEKTNVVKSIIWRLPFGSFGRNYEKTLNNIQNPDFVYIRFNYTDKRFLKFLKELYQKYPKCKIIMEVPTYPYKKDLMQTPSMIPFYYKDCFYNKWLKRYIGRIVTFSDDDEIFGIQTIKSINGIDVASEKIVSPNAHDGNEINLLAVAIFQQHHGYERIIQGMSDYYNNSSIKNKREIFLNMVGEGPEKDNYVQLVKKLNLEDKVIFYGNKSGQELDDIYNKSDIAISSLGLYKLGINKLSALKTREYLAKGLPMITGCKVDVLTDEFPYYIEFENNGSAIKIEKIVEFYDKIYGSVDRNKVIANIRKFAEENVDMKKVMQPIVEYIKSDK
jgi:glycosyltransferase involved in cell wall biosynthesis